MGVPKFFRWLSERYPRINQPLSNSHSVVPEIDHLYFDLNGIIHLCSHNNNDSLSLRMTDEEIFKNIEAYMDMIVCKLINPQETIFIAVDGVAPRAKMNQQRGRRFRSARERMQSMQVGDIDSTNSPHFSDEHVFDSNCITPSTEFMVKLDEFLQDMIIRKISEDSDWPRVKVIYSGHNVPGEGEHKIMQHIRNARAQPSYRPNQRHCMYGQDADLMMLGLATHEPHFTILREEIVFERRGNGNQNFRILAESESESESEDTSGDDSGVTDQSESDDSKVFPVGLPTVEFVIPRPGKFQLLHLSVLREYIEVEFSHSHRGGPLDREKLIDDFILMTFFVGNDFLPHLPALDISENAFDVLFDAYKTLQNEKVGYFIEDGEIANFSRLEKFFNLLGKQEELILEKRALDARIKALHSNNSLSKSQQNIQTRAAMDFASSKEMNGGLLVKPHHDGTYQQEYYFEKFGKSMPNLLQTNFSLSAHNIESFVPRLVRHYLQGLVWCFAYYTKGCVSWEWFYPHHYGPMITDIKDIKSKMLTIDFNLGSPLPPFQQLLGCLPPNSSGLLPKPYQDIMLSDSSPMKPYYPLDFEEDMNGKQNYWEAVILLPFIDIGVLQEAVADVEADANLMSTISNSIKDRNKFGCILSYTPGQIDDDEAVHCKKRHYREDLNLTLESFIPDNSPGKSFSQRMINGTVIPHDKFPSLRSLPIKYVFVRLLHHKAVLGLKYKTLILGVGEQPIYDNESLKLLLGRHVFVNYPMRLEAKVLAVGTPSVEFSIEDSHFSNENCNIVEKQRDQDEKKMWLIKAKKHQEMNMSGRKKKIGSGSGGIAIGTVNTLLTVVPVVNFFANEIEEGEAKRVYGTLTSEHPIQLVQFDIQFLWRQHAHAPVGKATNKKFSKMSNNKNVRNFSTNACKYLNVKSSKPISAQALYTPLTHIKYLLKFVK